MKKYLIELFQKTSEQLVYLNEVDFILSIPAQKSHGDYSTNVAMLLSKKLKRNPKEIAEEIISNFDYDKSIIEKIEIAGPGFINFFFKKNYLPSIVKYILNEKDDYGKSKKYSGKKALVEFISANPTGPLTVGHGRNAVIGDTVANLLEWIGYKIEREYYFNNAGRQMRVLGDSVRLRYLELLGEGIEFPEDYYQGEYIKEIAQKLRDEFGDSLKNENPDGIFKQRAEKEIFEDIIKTMQSIKIKMNNFFNEHSLYEEGKIKSLLDKLAELNLSYEKDNAVWLKLTALGNDQDKVIVKSSGEPTYRLPDIAYHITKFERGYDLMVDLFGSDHNATYPDVLAGLRALGYDTNKVKVLIHQFVTILQKGEVVKMSTRKANYITLDELINEVGPDVVRYFFIMRSMTSHLNFDLELAKKHSDENPVFYLQYAHARISSILRMTKDENLIPSLENLDLLTTDVEQDLLKKLFEFPEVVLISAENYEPHKIANYLEELAATFHKFYTECRIIGSEKNLAEARISLAIATQIVLRNGLSILGVSAPNKM
ncbi:arginine--tRNA ligase [Stygiobacter electus]|uniref:Arginine--tRNA ligase n=1 Tax=Stygiobacter electus TaxID=3032292 RepID=A0AAE3TB55_9BACT|nr:arginine--tRNA ligase [Stygiobacter electus]MDF1610963.1 arginine--tRNA ligase [Stygiobacter electus]